MTVEIYTHDRYDIESRNVEEMFSRFSNRRISIKMTKLYRIDGCENEAEIRKIAKEILVDPIVEDYFLRNGRGILDGYKGFVDVFLKDSVTDVVGESVSDVVRRIMGKIVSVRTGRCFYFSNLKEVFVDFVREEFLNEVIHKMSVEEF